MSTPTPYSTQSGCRTSHNRTGGDIVYQRILLKLSGEALGKEANTTSADDTASKTRPISPETLARIAQDIATLVTEGVQLGIVIGGGNWFRGSDSASMGLERMTADHIGMLATVMNALALRDALVGQGLVVQLMSAVPIPGLATDFDSYSAQQHLQKRHVVIFAGGTGHPFVSTDSAASLRALEIKADILLKATSVDGIYSADPTQHPEAILYSQLSYQQVLDSELGVMDLAAFCQCRDYGLPIRVFNINTPQGLVQIARGAPIGTLVSA